MIRLALSDSLLRDMTPRLRDTTLHSSDPQSVSSCDAVVVLAPTNVDDPSIEQLLQTRKHVLLSAELCSSLQQLQSLTDVARQSGAQLALANWERYYPSRQLLRQQLDTGKLGAPGLIRSHYWGSPSTTHSTLSDLDLVLWYFGQSPNLVHAVEQESLLIHLGFPGGGMALIDHLIRPHQGAYRSLSIVGSNGAAYADDHQNMQLIFHGGHTSAVLAEEGFGFFATLIQEFIDALNAGRDLSVSSWRNALIVADAVRKSIERRQALVPEELS